jgi:hypothetical protein
MLCDKLALLQYWGCRTVLGLLQDGPRSWKKLKHSGTRWEARPKRVRAPYAKCVETSWRQNLSTVGHEESCGNLGGPSPKAKYVIATDSEEVP